MQSVNNPRLNGQQKKTHQKINRQQKIPQQKIRQNVARHQIARLAALTLIFSYAELLIPRVVPFFRLGLGNAALLLGFGLSFPAFMLLSVIKSVAVNLMAGTLFSPFFLVSLAQSVTSALMMFAMSLTARRQKIISLYGISVTGSAVSAAVQISLCSFYLGQGTWSLFGPMLLFNVASGVITAWLAETLGGGSPLEPQPIYAEGAPFLAARISEGNSVSSRSERPAPSAGTPLRCLRSKLDYNAPRNILRLTLLLSAAASVFFIKNIAILGGYLFLSFLAQKLSKRKILLLPHLSLWLFVLITSAFVPNGRILFSVAGFSITQGALLSGLQKALRLSTVAALSQCAAALKPNENTLLGLTLSYYKLMLDSFRKTPGSVFTKLKAALK